MATLHEEVGRAHEQLNFSVRNSSQQMYPSSKPWISLDPGRHLRSQGGAAETAPQLQARELANRLAHAVQDGQRVLVGIQMPDP
jgi:hypothetical protein